MSHVPEQVKAVGDVMSIAGILSLWAGAFTTVFGLVASVATAAWALLRLYETKTVQDWLAHRNGQNG